MFRYGIGTGRVADAAATHDDATGSGPPQYRRSARRPSPPPAVRGPGRRPPTG